MSCLTTAGSKLAERHVGLSGKTALGVARAHEAQRAQTGFAVTVLIELRGQEHERLGRCVLARERRRWLARALKGRQTKHQTASREQLHEADPISCESGLEAVA